MIYRMLYIHLYLQRLVYVFDVEKPPFIQVPDSGDGQILLSAEKEQDRSRRCQYIQSIDTF